MKLNGTYQVSFCQNSPLKIRGVRGVMEVTPFIPLTLRVTLKEIGEGGVIYENK
jgi:hypothetical protein